MPCILVTSLIVKNYPEKSKSCLGDKQTKSSNNQIWQTYVSFVEVNHAALKVPCAHYTWSCAAECAFHSVLLFGLLLLLTLELAIEVDFGVRACAHVSKIRLFLPSRRVSKSAKTLLPRAPSRPVAAHRSTTSTSRESTPLRRLGWVPPSLLCVVSPTSRQS